MKNIIKSKKTLFILFLLFLVFLSINTKWLWQAIYPIKYENFIKQNTTYYSTDPFLVLSIIQVETRFNNNKVSKKGAMGVMQLMPTTAKWIMDEGHFYPYSAEDLIKPEVNIALGSWYLSWVYQKFDRNLIATIAAYNAGPGNVEKWLENGTWDGSLENQFQIPFGETRHYVQRVLYFYDRYRWIYAYHFN